ncbi:hypothetical protein B0H12DRAFT_1332454 [Mycena haematopus]|nr:hypothetical protein B0H12DRAFT_1332454 [Mycena haematopus]
MNTSKAISHTADGLRRFQGNKSILGVCADFNLPKLHNDAMYIKLFGTTDNYITEYTILTAKDAYRATNFKDEFPQMTHEKYIECFYLH